MDFMDIIEMDYFASDASEEETEYYNPYSGPIPKTCKHCGKKNLEWINTKDGWRLADEYRTVHRCPHFEKKRETKKKMEEESLCISNSETEKSIRLSNCIKGIKGIHKCP